MGEYKQDNRFIQVYTPLDPDVLLLAGFHGQEGVSRLFNFELRMHSEKGDLTFNKIVGKSMTIKMLLSDNRVRYINGIVSSFTQGGSWILRDGRHHQNLANYNATLVPWLWLLTRTGDCRIFQGKSVPEIISEVFKEHKFSDFVFRLEPGDYAKREYCVQYRETDFNFVSRLMEEEGIFYFFEHYENKHVMVLADKYDHFKKSSLLPSISYSSNEYQEEDGEIRDWSVTQEVRPGKYTVTDFNFMRPEFDLTRTSNGADERKLEVYDYPGEFTEDKQGERLARLRMEEEQSSMTVTNGTSSCRGLAAGYWFNLYDHYQSDFDQPYVVLSVYHSAEQGANYHSTSESAAADFIYSNRFQCIRYRTQYRPPRVTPVPIVHGSQTAIVVGPDDEEIYVDQYGRVKVQFHWDRAGKYKVEKDKPGTSCWVRVSQNWAGKRWGAIFLPRVGQEVIVDFLEGDPDKPIITGRVYNGQSMPPYELPEHKTISGIKSNSSSGGGGFNEIRFEDKKGSEQLFIHAERNHDIRIKRDRIEWVGNESHLIVKKDLLEMIEGNKHLQVKGDRNEKVDGTVSLLSGKDILRKTRTKYALDAENEILLKVGENFIKIDKSGIRISGTSVWINCEDSNRMADVGGDSSPKTPRAPREADHADPGARSQLPPPKTEVKPEAYRPGEVILKQAPQIGPPGTPPAQGSQEEELRSKEQELEMQQQELQRQREEFSRTAPLFTEQEQVIEPGGTVTATFDRAANSISNNGLQFIARWESFVPTPYNDAGNHAAIGYGHLLHRGPVTEADRRQFPNGMTRERGWELLRADAAIAENAVTDNVDVLLNQNQFDALTSFAYNVGAEAFANSTLLRELNAGNYDAVPGQMNRWVNSEGRRVQGLVNRRAAEGELFKRVP
jgi:type VI secretion system secreted protein VgrG